MDRVEALRSTTNISEFESLGRDLEKRWKHRSEEEYSELMRRMCEILISYKATDSSRRDLAEHYATALFEEKIRMSIATELALSIFLQVPRTPQTDEKAQQRWSQDRRRKSLCWLGAWKRLEQQIDPAFDPDKLPVMSVGPPGETGLPPGIEPSAVKDPQLRAQYEKSIAQRSAYLAYYGTQSYLRQVHREFQHAIETRMIQAYSIPPFDDDELGKSLTAYVGDQEMVKRILEGVRRRRQPATRPAARGASTAPTTETR